jgi:phospholipase/carboxylesterase
MRKRSLGWNPQISRRQMVGNLLLGVAAFWWTSSQPGKIKNQDMKRTEHLETNHAAEEGRLLARPGVVEANGPTGLRKVGLEGGRDGLLYVPTKLENPAPFALMLHGAGGNSRDGMDLLRAQADENGLILLAPDSRGGTWDIILGGYGPDVEYIDRALQKVFEQYIVDARRLAVGGFSDGASYGLSLGITNGGLFSHVIAFSPGFMHPTRQPDSPKIYVSHGEADPVLPIDPCSRRLVPALKRAGYEVNYHEFKGRHEIPRDIRQESVKWFRGTPK